MTTATVVQPQHLHRTAVISLRQSTGHQVLTNTASLHRQHALRDPAHQLGWRDEHIEVVAADLGRSAQSPAGRDGDNALLAEVALGQGGLVRSAESPRLSRHGTAWSPVRDLCTSHQCRIADREGGYEPSTPNGRLLLGRQGILREVELQTRRGRLLAGGQQKAQRGDLALALPAGLLRLEAGPVGQDPDLAVPHAMTLVFQPCLLRTSASQVVRVFPDHGLHRPRRHRHGETLGRTPPGAAVVSLVRNPASAGPVVYGTTRRQPRPGGARAHQRRQPQADGQVIGHDHSPASITGETLTRMQASLDDNDATDARHRPRGVPRQGAAWLPGSVYCGSCGHQMVGPYQGGHQ
jgi:DNA invertase Pin-like site-specific DNA recombinase